jgi:nicotinamide-nucleotide amidase
VGRPIEELLGPRLYSRNGDSLEAVVGALLRAEGASLAVAESCTGGMLAERITSVEGASDYFLGGFLTYTNRMKTELLGVDPEILALHSAVSEAVALAMAECARVRADATYALAITGEAGPHSATGAPVGTIYVGLAAAVGPAEAKRYLMPADRERVRGFAVNAALDLLRRRMLGLSAS